MTLDCPRRHNVNIAGRGHRPIVFAHGFGCDQQMWRFVAPAFEANHRVVLFDHIGCGKSDLLAYDPERHRRLEGCAQDVVDLLDALDLHDVVFVGRSVSAMIGLLASVMGSQGPADLTDELQTSLCAPPVHQPPLRQGHLPGRQAGRPAPGDGARAYPAMRRRCHRTGGRGLLWLERMILLALALALALTMSA